MKTTMLTIALLCAAATLAQAGPITVDGNLADWGVTVVDSDPSGGDDTASNMNEYTDPLGIGLIGFMAEDTNDLDNNYQVGPDWGGQNYDAEFLAVASDGTNLFMAIVSGQRPDNGATLYAPGDIRIETNAGVFGIEVGGGAYGPGDSGNHIEESDAGTTYALSGNGYTDSVNFSILQLAGSVWQDATWQLDPIGPGFEAVQQITGGTYAGLADYYFSRNEYATSTAAWGGQHSIIELSVPLSVFGTQNILNDIYWRPSCGNDELHVEIGGFTITQVVPLPAGFLPGMIVLAAFGMAGVIRRRRTV